MKTRLFIFISILVFLHSCGLDSEEYLSHINDPQNGLNWTHDKEGNRYSIQYVPVELLAHKEANISEKSEKVILSELKGLDYYFLEINKDNQPNAKEQFYYAFEFEKDVYLLHNQDTIRPSLFHLEQGIQGASQLRINLAFTETNQNRKIEINDKYGTKESVTIRQSDINKLPKFRD